MSGGKNETLLRLKNIDSDTDERSIISAIQAKLGNNELHLRSLKSSHSEMKEPGGSRKISDRQRYLNWNRFL